MITLFQHVATLVGRILLSAIFLASGINHILHWGQSIAAMDAQGVPLPNLLLVLAVTCMLAGGVSVLVGLRARLGAMLLILFLIPTTLLFHNYWAVGSEEMTNQMHHFMKNLGLIGGLLMVVAFGAGGFSIDMLLRIKKAARQV